MYQNMMCGRMKEEFHSSCHILISIQFNTLLQQSKGSGMKMIAIVDYDAGNLKSVEKAMK